MRSRWFDYTEPFRITSSQGDQGVYGTYTLVLGGSFAAKRSASRLLLPQATDAVTGNSYRKQKKPSIKGPTQEDQDTCTYCVTRGHRRNPPTMVRRTECPAFGTKCNHCNKNHHFERMCRGKQGTRSTRNTEHDDAISDTLCEITSVDSTKSTTLDHHVFDNLTREWSRRQSKPQPYIRLQMGIQQEDYNHFGFTLRIPQKQSPVSAMADTGCQSCLAGLKIVKKLGLSTKDRQPQDACSRQPRYTPPGRRHTEVIREKWQGRSKIHQANGLCD